MSRNWKLSKIALYLGMEIAALMGAPLRPDELDDLLRSGQVERIEFNVCGRRDDPDSPPSLSSADDPWLSRVTRNEEDPMLARLAGLNVVMSPSPVRGEGLQVRFKSAFGFDH